MAPVTYSSVMFLVDFFETDPGIVNLSALKQPKLVGQLKEDAKLLHECMKSGKSVAVR